MRRVVLTSALFASLLWIVAGVTAQSATVFPVHFHVGRSPETSEPVVDEAWLDEQIARANEIFTPTAVRFVKTQTVPLEVDPNILTRRQRHRLGPHLHERVINVFVVEALKDVDVEDRFIRGVHWRSFLVEGSHFVILSKIAGRSVLAHELGHFFGNPHSDVPGNVMSYQRGEGVPFFDVPQRRRIRRFARRFGQGELEVLPSPSASTDAQPSAQPN